MVTLEMLSEAHPRRLVSPCALGPFSYLLRLLHFRDPRVTGFDALIRSSESHRACYT